MSGFLLQSIRDSNIAASRVEAENRGLHAENQDLAAELNHLGQEVKLAKALLAALQAQRTSLKAELKRVNPQSALLADGALEKIYVEAATKKGRELGLSAETIRTRI